MCTKYFNLSTCCPASRRLPVALALTLFLTGTVSTQAIAAPIGVNYLMDLAVKSGPDSLGLGGATLSLTLLFNDTDVYVDKNGFPGIDAASNLLTVAGASVAGTNGSYTDPSGIGFFPTFDGQYFGVSDANPLAIWTIGGQDLVIFRVAEAVGGIAVGDTLLTSHFGTSIFNMSTSTFPDRGNWINSTDSTHYTIATLQTTFVPEPATLLLLGTGLAVAGVRRRLKKRS